MTSARFVAACAFAIAAFACGPAPEPVTPDTPMSTAAAAPERPPDPGTPADTVVAEALVLVSRVRELPVRMPVPGVRLDRETLRTEVERLLADESPPELVEGNTELLFALDTVPADFDLKAALGVLLGAQLAGFYDPEKKRMVLATDLGEEAERLTLYHELVHALQDQHYDLEDALDWKPEQSDVQAALHCLGEGDATAAMIDVFAHARGDDVVRPIPPDLLRLDGLLMEASPELASVPGIITRSLIAPYVDGLAFVNALRQRAPGFRGVDEAWRRRPLSTEHILHPEKFFAMEPVVPIAEIPAPPGFTGPTYRDVMGEQSLRLLFEEWAPVRKAAEAASDWGGDRLAVFQKGDTRVVRWHLAFDTEPAAERAMTMLARGALRPELGPDTPSPRPLTDAQEAAARSRSGKLCQERPQRGAFAIVRHQRHIGVTLGPYTRAGTSVRSAGSCPQALAWAEALAQQQ